MWGRNPITYPGSAPNSIPQSQPRVGFYFWSAALPICHPTPADITGGVVVDSERLPP